MMKLLIAVFVTLLLVACSNNAKNALAQAHAEADPINALHIIERAEEAEADTCAASMFGCFGPNKILSEAEDEYFSKAARAGDARVLRDLSTRSGKWDVLLNELKGSVLERAKTTSNPDLLVAAANILGDDRMSIVNTAQEISYLKNAWTQGDEKSAGRIAHHYVRNKDYESAYLWSLRCIGLCYRYIGARIGEEQDQIELTNLEKHLRTNQIVQLQQQALSKTDKQN